jgi:hypothetical protein
MPATLHLRRTRPAPSSTLTCFEAAANDMRKGAANSPMAARPRQGAQHGAPGWIGQGAKNAIERDVGSFNHLV